MKLTDLELDNLLEAKKTSASVVPAPDAEAVAAAFLVELRRRQANRRRVLQAIDEAEKDARRIGALIGCKQ